MRHGITAALIQHGCQLVDSMPENVFDNFLGIVLLLNRRHESGPVASR